jgi:hypothetical protein
VPERDVVVFANSSADMTPDSTYAAHSASSAIAAARCVAQHDRETSPAFENPSSIPFQNDFVVCETAFQTDQSFCSRISSMSTRAAGFPRTFLPARIS